MTSRDDDGAAAPESERAGMAGTGHGPPPAMPDAYEVALDRLLDGLESDPAVDTEAGASASTDIALIRRGLGIIAAELAGGTAAAATADEAVAAGTDAAGPPPAAVPLAPVRASGRPRPVEPRRAGDAPVVPLPRPSAFDPQPVPDTQPAPAAWWRRPAPAVLAAAASLTLVLTLGVAVLGGGDSGDSTAQQAPAATTDSAASAENPDAASLAGPPTATAGGGVTTSGKAAGAAAPAADAAAPAFTPGGAAAAKSSRASFATTVACARAIVVGEVLEVQDVAGSERARVTFAVTEYLKGEGMTTRTFVVGSRSARFEELGPLAAGQRGLFLVPQRRDANVRAWLDDNVPTGRKKVLAAMEQRGDC